MAGEFLGSAVAGIVFGLALAAPPGPMNAIIAEESVRRGWTAGFKAGLGAMTADLLFAVLAFLGVLTVAERVPELRAVMVMVGGGLMLYFAFGALRGAAMAVAKSTSGESRGFSKTLALSLVNPYQILFWLTVGVGLLESGELDIFGRLPVLGDPLAGLFVVRTGSLALLGGFFGGILLWIVVFPAILVRARQRLDMVELVVAVGSALVLATFGVVFLWDGLGSLR